jgi:hypothetical protein
MASSSESSTPVTRLFPSVTPLNTINDPLCADRQTKAIVGLYSRECSAELLARLTGSNCFVERPLAPEVIEAADLNSHLLYITAPDLPDKDYVIDYYIRLKPYPPEKIASIKQKIVVLAIDNSDPLWLSQKLTAKEANQARDFIANWISARHQSGQRVELHTFEPSAMTELFAQELGLEPDQAPSNTIKIGSKYYAKQIFQGCGLYSPPSTKECYSLTQLAKEMASLLQQESNVRQLILKLSSTLYGAGQGNALFNISGIKPDNSQEDTFQQVFENLTEENIEVVDKKLDWKGFVEEIPKAGVIAELYIEGQNKESPSVQGIVYKDGTVNLVSIHEQRFASNKQTYIGSFYPANDDYRDRVADMFNSIASQAYKEGHIGPISVDFLCVRNSPFEDWCISPIEINNRLTGTAHCFRIVTSLLGKATPKFQVNGETRVYLASDSIYKPEYVGLRPSEVIDAIIKSNIHYDDKHKKGVVLYMLSGLAFGKCGAVVIGSSEDECKAMQASIYGILDNLVIAPSTQNNLI